MQQLTSTQRIPACPPTGEGTAPHDGAPMANRQNPHGSSTDQSDAVEPFSVTYVPPDQMRLEAYERGLVDKRGIYYAPEAVRAGVYADIPAAGPRLPRSGSSQGATVLAVGLRPRAAAAPPTVPGRPPALTSGKSYASWIFEEFKAYAKTARCDPAQRPTLFSRYNAEIAPHLDTARAAFELWSQVLVYTHPLGQYLVLDLKREDDPIVDAGEYAPVYHVTRALVAEEGCVAFLLQPCDSVGGAPLRGKRAIIAFRGTAASDPAIYRAPQLVVDEARIPPYEPSLLGMSAGAAVSGLSCIGTALLTQGLAVPFIIPSIVGSALSGAAVGAVAGHVMGPPYPMKVVTEWMKEPSGVNTDFDWVAVGHNAYNAARGAVFELIRHGLNEGADNFTFIGHSLGGALAMDAMADFARTHPSRADGAQLYITASAGVEETVAAELNELPSVNRKASWHARDWVPTAGTYPPCEGVEVKDDDRDEWHTRSAVATHLLPFVSLQVGWNRRSWSDPKTMPDCRAVRWGISEGGRRVIGSTLGWAAPR
jgi:alpha-beta hydrolase superfamily lysophospholipase